MKGHMQDGKFHPHTDYKKGVRKSRDQKVKTEGVRMKRTKDWLDKLNKKQQYQAYLDWSKEREKMYPDEKWELLKKKGLTREKDFKFWKRMEHAIVKGQPEEEGGNIANERKARDGTLKLVNGAHLQNDDGMYRLIHYGTQIFSYDPETKKAIVAKDLSRTSNKQIKMALEFFDPKTTENIEPDEKWKFGGH